MTFLKFDQKQLVNLEYSLSREVLSTNRAGGYFSTSIVLCNTRKYHGMLILPISEFDGENHVLLSCVDETVVQHGQSFELGIHRYPGLFAPHGHKHIVDFSYDKTASITYRVGGVVLKKELLFVHNEEQFMIRYTLQEAHSPTRLHIKPFLAFRNIHQLSKANMWANTKYRTCRNGVIYKLYTGFPNLHMQLNRKNEFVAAPDWYYNLEYPREIERGYEGREDLFVPGYFDIGLKVGESVIFSAATAEQNPASLIKKFNAEMDSRCDKSDFKACIANTASQFVVRKGKDTEIVAGYPWFGSWGRDTFISLPALSLWIGNPAIFKAVTNTMHRKFKNGLFPNMGNAKQLAFNSVDAPLWYFWAVQQYYDYCKNPQEIWTNYGQKMKQILEGYTHGLPFNIKMHENGLIWAGEKGYALTWMDAVVDGKPVTPRIGYDVEINALWYNAIRFTQDMAQQNDDKKWANHCQAIAKKIEATFVPTFWIEEKGYLADYVDDSGQNHDIRPNQLFAVSLPYSPIDEAKQRAVLQVVTHELFTPKGLRTLSPRHPDYKGKYLGDQSARDRTYHQGTAWPWLLGPFVEAQFKLNKNEAIALAQSLIDSFLNDITGHGICATAEVYDGDPPQHPRGAISQAWSTAALIQIQRLIDIHKNSKE